MLGLFSKERALQRKHKKLRKKLGNMYAQTADRMWAAHQLVELGTREAVRILLDRFENSATNHTIDQDEKRQVCELLTQMDAELVVEETRKHLRREILQVNRPIRVLQHFLEDDELTDFLADLIEELDIEYTRDPERKEELVRTAADYGSERLGRALLPLLADTTERIRFLVVDALFEGGYEFAREPILQRLAKEEESIRVSTRILERMTESDWTVKGFKAAIEETLPEGFAVTRAGTIRRRG